MDGGYDVEPRPVGQSTHRHLWLGVVAAVAVLAVVVIKPWADAPAPPTRAAITTPGAIATPAFAVVPVGPAIELIPIWPAASVPSPLADSMASRAEAVLGELTAHSGAWGVGNAGVGPRMVRDEPWVDWVAAHPESVDRGPLHVATSVTFGLCDGFPTIYDHPSVVAVTAPDDLVPDWRLAGWWTDGTSVASLAGSIRQVSPAGNRGISYLERSDRAQWPRGRYEFHVIAGQSTVALTVCITGRG